MLASALLLPVLSILPAPAAVPALRGTAIARQARADEHCYGCHSSAGEAEGGVRLDHRDAMLEESLFGPIVSPGAPQESVLLQVMRHELEGLEMPEGGAQLDDRVLEDFEAWILAGAFDPRDDPPAADEVERLLSWEARLERRMDWWSLQPVEDPPLPDVKGADHPVDRFVEARLRDEGLRPASPATRRSWRVARRTSPVRPSPAMVAANISVFSTGEQNSLVPSLRASSKPSTCAPKLPN